MKILHLIDSGGLYGAEVSLLTLARAQRQRGDQPIIGSLVSSHSIEKPVEHAARSAGLSTGRVVVPAGLDLRGFARIRKLVGEERPDVVHAHGYKAIVLVGYLARRSSVPCVATVHGYTSTGRITRVAFYEALDRFMLRYMHSVAVVAASQESMLLRAGVDPRRIKLIPNGIDREVPGHAELTASEKAALEFAAAAPTVVGVGRLAAEKNFSMLIDAFANVATEGQGARLVIAGDGPLRGEIMGQVRRLGLDRHVMMPGYVRSSVLMPSARVTALSSSTEGLPMIVLESMRQRVPVVATAVGAVPDLLEQGRCGQLVAPQDTDALSAALRRALAGDATVTEQVERARQRFLNHYTADRLRMDYDELYARAGSLISEHAHVA